MKILVVEDTEDSRILLEDNLLINNFDVISAEDGVQALEMLSREKVDMVISDILMPEMDGFELCRRMKKDTELASIPFIFYTATYTDSEDEKLALKLGADLFLIKPLEPEVVITKIQSVLESYQQRETSEAEVSAQEQIDTLHLNALNRKLNKKVRELEQQKRQLQLLTDALPVLISEIDMNQCYRYVNKAYEHWHGIRREDVIGMPVKNLVGDEAYKTIGGFLNRCLSGEQVEYESQVVLKHCGKKYIHALYIPILDIDGKQTGCYALVSDITAQKEQQQQIQRIAKMDALDNLTSGISHDYNNMLGIILGYAELLEYNLRDEGLKNYIYQIQKAANRGASLTKKLLSFTRQNLLQAKVINLNEEIYELENMLEKTLTVKVKLTLDLQADLWNVYLSVGDFEDALINICINALHAMPQGGELVIKTENKCLTEDEVAHSNLNQNECVQLTVTDTGIGINETVLGKVFDPFFTTKGKQGTGLGLSQVYGFITGSDGEISIESEPEKGTSIKLLFPRTIRPKDQTSETEETIAVEVSGRKHILVVDDEEALREIIIEMLESNGFQVSSAGTASEAIEMLDKNRFDILVTDIILPGINGYELANIAARKYPAMKVQLISGYAAIQGEDSISDEQKENILFKPFTSQQLINKLNELLRN